MSPEEIEAALDQIKGKEVLVIGDAMLDEYIYGKAERVSAEVPVLIVDRKRRDCALGGAGNAALNLMALGAKITFCAVVGRDEAGSEILNGKRPTARSNWSVIEDKFRKTTVKTRVIANDHQVLRIDHEDRMPLRDEVEQWMMRNVTAAMNWAEAVLVSDYGKGVFTERLADHIRKLAEGRGVPLVIDPKRGWETYIGATALTPNVAEMKAIHDAYHDDHFDSPATEPNEMAAVLVTALGLEGLLVTRGAAGMMLYEATRNLDDPIQFAARNDAIDVAGAGDTVAAAFCACIAAHIPMAEAAEIANIAAGVAVCKRGCASATPEEIIAAVRADLTARQAA